MPVGISGPPVKRPGADDQMFEDGRLDHALNSLRHLAAAGIAEMHGVDEMDRMDRVAGNFVLAIDQ